MFYGNMHLSLRHPRGYSLFRRDLRVFSLKSPHYALFIEDSFDGLISPKKFSQWRTSEDFLFEADLQKFFHLTRPTCRFCNIFLSIVWRSYWMKSPKSIFCSHRPLFQLPTSLLLLQMTIIFLFALFSGILTQIYAWKHFTWMAGGLVIALPVSGKCK